MAESVSPQHQQSVLLVEDHELLAHSLRAALEQEGLTVRVVNPATAEEVLEAARGLLPDLVLLDLDLRGGLDGVHLVGPLTELGTQVLVVTGSSDRMRVATCVELGAVAHLAKNAPFEQLLTAVLDASALQALLTTPQRLDLLAELRAWRAEERRRTAGLRELTPREHQVLGELTEGRSAADIAERWVVSEATVRTQIRAVLTKLGVRSQLAAVAEARRAGWR